MITTHADVFEPNFCVGLYEDALAKVVSEKISFTTNFFWKSGLVRSSTAILIMELEEDVKLKIYEALIDKGIISSSEGFSCFCYVWTRGSYISWHNDSPQEVALTVYLNPHWDIDWGGLFLYKENENVIKAVQPKFNTVVVNTDFTPHAVSVIANDAMLRLTLQIFKRPNLK